MSGSSEESAGRGQIRLTGRNSVRGEGHDAGWAGLSILSS